MYKWTVAITLTSACILFAGCGQTVTYRPSSFGDADVEASVDDYYNKSLTKANLSREWLERYLIDIVDEFDRPLYIENKIKPMIPDIQRALSDWGNVTIRGCLQGNRRYQAHHWVNGNIITGEARTVSYNAKYVMDKILPQTIPQSAYLSNNQ